MDQWIQKLSLLAVLLLIVLAVHLSTMEVLCWSPAHFRDSHSKHATITCSGNQTRKYGTKEIDIPKGNETSPEWSGFVRAESKNLQRLLFAEAMLVCVVYCAVRWLIVAGTLDTQSPSNLHTSYIKVPIYLIIQVIACIAWIAFAVNTKTEEDLAEADASFLCDFKIRRLGNIQRYTLQCAERGEELLRGTLMANFGLCLIIVVTKLTHLIMVFLIQPILLVKSMATTLAEKNINICMFVLTDLYFSMLAKRQANVSPTREKESEPGHYKPLVS